MLASHNPDPAVPPTPLLCIAQFDILVCACFVWPAGSVALPWIHRFFYAQLPARLLPVATCRAAGMVGGEAVLRPLGGGLPATSPSPASR